MKFIVSSTQLLKQLQHIAGVINANTVLPILEDFLFEIDKNKLSVVATDLETVMRIQLDIEAKEAGKEEVVGKLSRGDYFGELALLNNAPRAATVAAASKLRVVTMSERAFTRLLGPLAGILERHAKETYGDYTNGSSVSAIGTPSSGAYTAQSDHRTFRTRTLQRLSSSAGRFTWMIE